MRKLFAFGRKLTLYLDQIRQYLCIRLGALNPDHYDRSDASYFFLYFALELTSQVTLVGSLAPLTQDPLPLIGIVVPVPMRFNAFSFPPWSVGFEILMSIKWFRWLKGTGFLNIHRGLLSIAQLFPSVGLTEFDPTRF
jgi:hypothetical protein